MVRVVLIWSLVVGSPFAGASVFTEDTVIFEVGERPVRYGEISCSSAITGTPPCKDYETQISRKILFKMLLEIGVEQTGVKLTDEENRDIEAKVKRSSQGSESSAWHFRCAAAGALALIGEPAPDLETERECTASEDEVSRLSKQLTVEKLRGAISRNLEAEMTNAVRDSLIRSALYEKVNERRGDGSRGYWRKLYDDNVSFAVEEYELRYEEVFP